MMPQPKLAKKGETRSTKKGCNYKDLWSTIETKDMYQSSMPTMQEKKAKQLVQEKEQEEKQKKQRVKKRKT